MVKSLKEDLQISDFEVGLLQGPAFALFYASAGIPIGIAVDRFARRWIIWIGVTFWAVAATACGLASSYWQLLAARLGLGAGEASLGPAAHSMLADAFPKERLALAVSLMTIGATLGNGLALGIGGAVVSAVEGSEAVTLPLIGECRPWQAAFILTGAPGLVLALLIFLIPEPRRTRSAHPKAAAGAGLWGFLKSNRRYLICHTLGFLLIATTAFGVLAWIPAYLQRSFGMSVRDLTLPLALVYGLGPTAGMLLSGWAADRWFGKGRLDAHLRYAAGSSMCVALFGIAAFAAPSPEVFMVLIFFALMGMTMAGVAAASLQIVAPGELRGQMSAFHYLLSVGLGYGLGPPLVGALTDIVFGDEQSLVWSLASVVLVLPLMAAAVFWSGRSAMRAAVERAASRDQAAAQWSQ